MKSAYLSAMLLLLFLHQDLMAQHVETIAPLSLWVCCNKTSSLIFPYDIRSVDLGSQDVLAQKADGLDNILQLKAAREDFEETNLSVVTADGHFYSFLINYAVHPEFLNLRFALQEERSADDSGEVAHFRGGPASMAALTRTARFVRTSKKFIYGIRDRSYGTCLLLSGIYIRGDALFFKLELNNKSNISYDVDMLNFFVKDIRQSRRTAVQELEQVPLFFYPDSTRVGGHQRMVWVVAIPKCTLPGKKELVIRLLEKDGGRNLSLHLNNQALIKAKPYR